MLIFLNMTLLFVWFFCSYGHLIIYLFVTQSSHARWTSSLDYCIAWMWKSV